MYVQTTRASDRNVRSESLYKDCQGIDTCSIEPKLFTCCIGGWLEILKNYLLGINTINQVLNPCFSYLIVVGSSQFSNTNSLDRGSSVDY
jgi:hypothetical protein